MLSDFLPRGAANGIHAAELAQILSVTPRELRRRVNQERKQGVPIISGAFGYALPDDTDADIAAAETAACRRMFTRRALNGFQTLAAFGRAKNEPLAGQITFFDVEEGAQP